ncbi:MAG: HAD family phosphatase [Candidatus Zixiibacteriota bacterium]|nr:MAG: HAD family phosphatase [candidate division Zixibacteria bacterium]
MSERNVKVILLDLGGVVLTNGWDREARRRAVETFELEGDDFHERHRLVQDLFDTGRLELEEYLDQVVFHRGRPFSREDFRAFMRTQSQAHEEMITLIHDLKSHYRLRVAALSNESRELARHRVETFHLHAFVDVFVISGFVGLKKPDPAIYRLALDLLQVPAEAAVYLEDRETFVETARELGLDGIHHTGFESTMKALEERGLGLLHGVDAPY